MLSAILTSATVALTAGPAAAQECTGDCDRGGAVSVDEIVVLVKILLGQLPAEQCPSMDADGTGIQEKILLGVDQALAGCPPPPGPTPTPIRVEHLAIAAGEEMQVPAGSTIVAANGIEITGDLVAGGRGDLSLRADSGDIVLEGGVIRFAAEGEQPAAASRRGAGIFAPGLDVSEKGGNISVWAMAGVVDLKRDPVSDRLPRIVAQRGEDGTTVRVTEWVRGQQQSLLKGANGGNGGDIIIRGGDTVGVLRLPPDIEAAEGPVLVVGDGGDGGNLDIDGNFATDAEILLMIGGHGGRSGRLRLESINTVQVPPPTAGAQIVSGAGGSGGYVDWTVSGDGNGNANVLLPLVHLTMIGGRGGDGLTHGGPGSYAYYFSDYVINERGRPIAAVALYGGRGGDAFGGPSVITLKNAFGGNGGLVAGKANRGWGGGPTGGGATLNHGSRGGSISATGGAGGDVLGTVVSDSARAGNGGAAPADDDFGFVVGGRGGDGLDTCDGCAGGNGGDSGDATVRGGAGGNVASTAAAVNFQPGNGGGVLGVYGTEMGGHGGDGSPPGTAGRKGRITPEFGRGGTGGGMIGAPGELLGREFQTSDPMEGTLCGDTLQCTCNSESTDGSAWATSPFQARGASCENCCPGRCSSTSPPNTGIRVLRFTDVFVGDGFSVTTQVTAFYDACGQRDEFGNCREKFTFTCVAYGMGFECTSAYTGIVAGLEGRTLLAGHAFCHGVGNLCVGDGRACSLTFSGDGMSSTRTWQCTNCGDYGPSCASEQSASCRCLNFDRTGPGLLLVCDTCFGESCE